MRTARCVASQTVPSNNTTPRSNSAAMATARCSGEGMEVTKTVVRTRVKIAARVITTMRMVVKIEAMIRFMVCGRDRRIAQWAENQNVRQAVDVWAPRFFPETYCSCWRCESGGPSRLRIYKSAALQVSVNQTSRRLPGSNQWDSMDHT